MTSIFDTFQNAAKDKIVISTFLETCSRYLQTQTAITIAVAVYGPPNSGKTTLALAFAQCPPIRTAASHKTGCITAVVVPTRAKPVKLYVFDVLDAPVNFILTDCFAVLIDGQQPNFSYIDKIAAYAFQHQRAVVVISKTDLLDARQFRSALLAAAQARRMLERKVNSVHIVAAKLTENASQLWISSLLFEYYVHCKSISLERQLKEAQRTLFESEKINKQGFATRIAASAEKRQILIDKYLADYLFDLQDEKMLQVVSNVLEGNDPAVKNAISLMGPPSFEPSPYVESIQAENEKTRTLSDILQESALNGDAIDKITQSQSGGDDRAE